MINVSCYHERAAFEKHIAQRQSSRPTIVCGLAFAPFQTISILLASWYGSIAAPELFYPFYEITLNYKIMITAKVMLCSSIWKQMCNAFGSKVTIFFDEIVLNKHSRQSHLWRKYVRSFFHCTRNMKFSLFDMSSRIFCTPNQHWYFLCTKHLHKDLLPISSFPLF